MRGVNYLNVLLLSLLTTGTIAQGSIISQYATNIAKRILEAKSLPFEDCGSKYLILYLSISSCNSIPCVMKRGETVKVNVLFDDDNGNTTYIKHQVRWIFNSIITRAYISPDPCDGIDKCLSNDREGKFYWATLLVNNSLPAISGSMLWEAVNEYNEDVICFKVPVIVTP